MVKKRYDEFSQLAQWALVALVGQVDLRESPEFRNAKLDQGIEIEIRIQGQEFDFEMFVTRVIEQAEAWSLQTAKSHKLEELVLKTNIVEQLRAAIQVLEDAKTDMELMA
jgi:hypothetical protein